ncbi:hypothetical protein K501DRAFT_288473 [Backusella circina FSU 941]|nr:hypothetical protein K501DRAFT_288473 [Backusella circina FSU 941]
MKRHQMNPTFITPPPSPLLPKDWELEKSLLLHQIDEYKSYIDKLEKTHHNERARYQTNQQSLLREMENKDKKIKEIENNYQKKIDELCVALEDEREDFKRKEYNMIERYSSQTMLFEQQQQQKNERRFAQLHTDNGALPDTHDSQSQDHILTKVMEQEEQYKQNASFKEEMGMIQHQQMLMQCEARLENLVVEHQINIQDLQDAYGSEKEELEIQYQQQLQQEQEVLEIQYQQKLQQELEERSHMAQRLIHAEEKVCDLLAEGEINSKKLGLAEESVKRSGEKYAIMKRDTHSKLLELRNLQRQVHHASRIAKDILSITNSETPYELGLTDLLSKISNQVISLQTKTNMMEKSQDSIYGMPYYAF